MSWIPDSAVDHTISCSSYTKIPKELEHPRKGLINVQNISDNECIKWCLVRYLLPPDHHPAKIGIIDKDFPREPDFKDIQFPIKIRNTLFGILTSFNILNLIVKFIFLCVLD